LLGANRLPAKIIATTDQCEAINDADFVIWTIRHGGQVALHIDVDIPIKHWGRHDMISLLSDLFSRHPKYSQTEKVRMTCSSASAITRPRATPQQPIKTK
jgi:alpha-galactosidase/6-phospho-beta-glucosidase family protein